MSEYHAPIAEMIFVLTELGRLSEVAALPDFEDCTPDMVAAVLDEAAKFATNVLAPLNLSGDQEGCKRLPDGSVKTPTGFKSAYQQFSANGWNGLTKSKEYGGQGMPQLVATPVEEMWHSANMAFDLCPLLTQGAIEAIELAGSTKLKDLFLPKMVSGEWTGTMNLTESQAGSDLAAIRTRAMPFPDGSYRLFGQKIFITYGEHDFTDNIIHLVLARLPDAPIGIKGISLFVVPKFIVNDDGAIGSRNDVRCVSLEHKLGIHASPTAVLAYGDNGGATGYLIGERNRGLEYMFIMMNLARFSVGMEGVGISERAYQRAATFARERIQGRSVGFPSDVANTTIIEHPDIRRMLMTMRAYTEAMRAVAYETAATLDVARHHPNDSIRAQQQSQAEFMVPVIKGWCTETAQQVTSLGLQIHGGMGYIEETGVAQYTRDVRITTIYEGTTSIQANDFVSRKTARDGGKAARGRIQEILITANELSASDATNLVGLGEALRDSADWLRESLEIVLERLVSSPREAFAVSVPYLELWGVVCGGWQMGRAALVASQKMATCTGEKTFLASKLATSRYYIEALLPRGGALVAEIRARGNTVFTLLAEHF